MEEVARLDVACPPMLAEALGYEGGLRYVAFYRSPEGDDVRYSDGTEQGHGSHSAWFAFTEYPSVWPHLLGYMLGSSEQQARHWLLIDREQPALFVGEADSIGRFLSSHLPDEVRSRQKAAERALQHQDELLAKARRRMLRDATFLDQLSRWLDDRS